MLLDQYIHCLPDPLDTIKRLDEYVIGQDVAKKNLSILLLVRALMRLQKNGKIPNDIEIQKSNLLLIGPSGSGKTQLMKALSEIADIPILIKDVTGITSAGYIGGKVEDILIDYVNFVHNWAQIYCNNTYKLLDPDSEGFLKQDLMLDILETGIIYIDEVDKLLSIDKSKDITGDMVQNELLKVLEGEVVDLTQGRREKRANSGLEELNTKYITFVCGGAFSGLSDLILKRLQSGASIGFNSDLVTYNKDKDVSRILREVTTEDLVEYGFKHEFLGRLPLRATLDELDKQMMTSIITEPKNAIYSRYKEFFKLFGVTLSLDDGAIGQIAEKALDLKLGARSLHKIFNDIFIDDLANIFTLQNQTLRVSKKDIIKRLK